MLAYEDSGQVFKVRLSLSGAALEAPVQVSTGVVSGLVTVHQAKSGALIAWTADLGSGREEGGRLGIDNG